jgi:hypothetical protein
MELINQYAMVFVYLLLALQVADLATTLYVLRTGKGAEANPIAKKLMAVFGPEFGLALPKLLIAGVIWTVRDTTPPVVFAGLCVVYIVIVINNLKFALRTKP